MKRYTITVEEYPHPTDPRQDVGAVVVDIGLATRRIEYGGNPSYPLAALRDDAVLEASHWAEGIMAEDARGVAVERAIGCAILAGLVSTEYHL